MSLPKDSTLPTIFMITKNNVEKKYKNEMINIISGAFAGLTAAIVTCPIDMVKIRLQNKPSELSTMNIFKDIWNTYGFKGLYRGVSPTVAGYLPTWSLYFFVYDSSKRFYQNNYPGAQDAIYHIVAALQAGALSTTVTNPLWVVRTRIMTQTSNSKSYYYKSTREALITILKTEGWKALYKGLGPSLIGVSHVVIQFPIYEHLKKLNFFNESIDEKNISNIRQILFASSVSKMIASSITYPHEVIRTRLHTQTIASESLVHTRYISRDASSTQIARKNIPEKGPKYRGTWQTFSVILREESWRGFYRGFNLNLIRTVPASALTIATYEIVSASLRDIVLSELNSIILSLYPLFQEMNRNTNIGKKIKPEKSQMGISDIVDSVLDHHHIPNSNLPTNKLTAYQIYLNQKPKNVLPPNSKEFQTSHTISRGGSFSNRQSAGYKSGIEKGNANFGELLKSRAQGVKAERVLALNTTKNSHLSPAVLSTTSSQAIPANNDRINEINRKWDALMDSAISLSLPTKAKRSISFNETVTCHNIAKIKDIIAEFDSFEDEALSHSDSKPAHVDITQTKTGSEEFNMTIREILDTSIIVTIPESLSRQDEIFVESRTNSYVDSITSLAPACPTPDRSLSPIPEFENEAVPFSVTLNLRYSDYHCYPRSKFEPLKPQSAFIESGARLKINGFNYDGVNQSQERKSSESPETFVNPQTKGKSTTLQHNTPKRKRWSWGSIISIFGSMFTSSQSAPSKKIHPDP